MTLLQTVNIWSDIIGFGVWFIVIAVFWIFDFFLRITITGQFANLVLGKHDVKIKTVLGEYKGKPGEKLAHKH